MTQNLHGLMAFCLFFMAACSSSDPEVDFGDTTPPVLLSTLPGNGATDVDIHTTIEAVYDEAISQHVTQLRGLDVRNADDEVVSGFLMVENDRLTFRPSDPLQHNHTYTVQTSPRISDLFGNRAETHTWSFQTAPRDTPPLQPYNLSYPRITNAAEVTISGYKDGRSYIEVNGERTDVARNTSRFTVTVALNGDGEHDFVLIAEDEFGNRSNPAHVIISLHTEPPEPLSTVCGDNPGDPDLAGIRWQYQGTSICWEPENPLHWHNAMLPFGFSWTEPAADQVHVEIKLGNSVRQLEDLTIEASPYETDNLFTSTHSAGNAYIMELSTVDRAGNTTPFFRRDLILAAEAGLATFEVEPEPVGDAQLIHQLPAANASGISNQANLHAFFSHPVTNVEVVSASTINVRCGRDCRHWILEPETALASGEITLTATTDGDPMGAAVSVDWDILVEDESPVPAILKIPTAEFLSEYQFQVSIDSANDNPLYLMWHRASESENAWGMTMQISDTEPLQLIGDADPLAAFDVYLEAYSPDGMVDTGLDSYAFQYPDAPGARATVPRTEAASLLATADGYTAFLRTSGPGAGVRYASGSYTKNLNVDSCSGYLPSHYITPYPIVSLGSNSALLGLPCSGSSKAGVWHWDPQATLSSTRAQVQAAPGGATDYGASMAVGTLYEDGEPDRQLVVGSPSHNRVYLYDATRATSPSLVLKGNPNRSGALFGAMVALAHDHTQDASTPGTLAILAPGEPAVYFFDGGALFEGPPRYRARLALPPSSCVRRHELLSPGDIDGDGSQDLIVASWGFGECTGELDLHFIFGGETPRHYQRTISDAFEPGSAPLLVPQMRALGDLNNNGLADFGYVEPESGFLRIFYGQALTLPLERRVLPYPTVSENPDSRWLLLGRMDDAGFASLVWGRWDPTAATDETRTELLMWP